MTAGGSNIVSVESLLQNAEVTDCPTSPQRITQFPHRHTIGHISPPGVLHDASVQEACLMRYFIDNLACWVS
jgi:hypothetical protein